VNNRLVLLIGALVVVLVGVGWYFLLWQPTADEIEDVRAQTQTELAQAQTARARAAELREVRAQAAEIDAQLAEAETLVPTDVTLPAILRQIELAAADAGVELDNLSPSRPIEIDDETASYVEVELAFNVQGTYFQLVDLARRLEDPALMGRGLTWRFGTFSIAEEFPNLSGSLGASVYARAPVEIAGDEDAEDADDAEAADDGAEADTGEPPPPRPDGDDEEDIL